MNVMVRTTLALIAVVSLSFPAIAGGSTPVPAGSVSDSSVTASLKAPADTDLKLRQADFAKFAKSKVRQLNKNHRFSRSRMEVTRRNDGIYRARYHQIDDKSLSVKVRRSQSKSIPYVGVVRYTEQIFESLAQAPDQFDPESFAVVKVIPNRHIFSYKKGSWN